MFISNVTKVLLLQFIMTGYVKPMEAETAPFNGCVHGNKRIRVHAAMYLKGGRNVPQSIYGICQPNLVFSCFETLGPMDAPAVPVACPLPASEPDHQHFRHLGIYVSPIKNEVQYWPYGYVCYEIDTTQYSVGEIKLLAIAMKEYETNTNIQFLKFSSCDNNIRKDICGGCHNYIYVTKNTSPENYVSCYSYIGMVGHGRQDVILNSNCFSAYNYTVFVAPFGNAVHELGHAIGLIHEHKHPRRTTIILWENVPANRAEDFIPPDENQVDETPYDIDSIMHYGEYFNDLPRQESPHFLCVPVHTCKGAAGEMNVADVTTIRTSHNKKAAAILCLRYGTRICKYNEFPVTNKCVTPSEDFCQPLDRDIGAQDKLSLGDIATINKIYPRIEDISANLRKVPRKKTPVSESGNNTTRKESTKKNLGRSRSGSQTAGSRTTESQESGSQKTGSENTGSEMTGSPTTGSQTFGQNMSPKIELVFSFLTTFFAIVFTVFH